MVKKKNPTLASSAVSSGAAAKNPPNPSRRSAPDAPPPAPAPPAPSSSTAGPNPGDWPGSTTTKHDEKKAWSLGIISSDEGNIILPASEASTPAAAPMTQISTASSLSKGKEIPLTAAVTASPPGKPDLRAVISSLEAFASQYTSLEVDKAQLQKEVKSSFSKLEGAIKIAAEARQEVDSLKDELEGLKKRLKDEEASRLAAKARMIEKDDLLRQYSLALLKAADIPAEALDKLPNNSPANTLSMTLESHQLVQDLLQKGKGAMARMHSMIFPKIDQNKTLGQLIDAFSINTREVIEVFPVPSFTDDSSGACSESDRLHHMKDRIAQMEKDMRSASSSFVTASSELENLRSSYQELETKLMEAEQKREQAEKQLAEKNSEFIKEKGEFVLKKNADSETIKRQQKELNGLRKYMETTERHWDSLNEQILGTYPKAFLEV
nr:uncharacterized protein LOC127328493 [Lolium perenne]